MDKNDVGVVGVIWEFWLRWRDWNYFNIIVLLRNGKVGYRCISWFLYCNDEVIGDEDSKESKVYYEEVS